MWEEERITSPDVHQKRIDLLLAKEPDYFTLRSGAGAIQEFTTLPFYRPEEKRHERW